MTKKLKEIFDIEDKKELFFKALITRHNRLKAMYSRVKGYGTAVELDKNQSGLLHCEELLRLVAEMKKEMEWEESLTRYLIDTTMKENYVFTALREELERRQRLATRPVVSYSEKDKANREKCIYRAEITKQLFDDLREEMF